MRFSDHFRKSFDKQKKILQWFVNLIVRTLMGTDVPETISGF
ncbi:hypothetical protein [Leptospira wolffii]|nr:hypothetical protein [Leptospira wolffii]